MEILDLYDEYRNKTDKTCVRGRPIPAGFYRLVIHIVIFRSDGRMLIQQRAAAKDTDPGLWDVSVGGCATQGDDSRSAASRELSEELGLHIDFTHIRPKLTVNADNTFDDYYILELPDIDLTELTLQASEVQDVQWATLAQITDLIHAGQFVRYKPSFIRLLFDMRSGYGCHKKLLS